MKPDSFRRQYGEQIVGGTVVSTASEMVNRGRTMVPSLAIIVQKGPVSYHVRLTHTENVNIEVTEQ